MKKLGTLIGILILIGFANATLFIPYISIAKLPGGEVGMMPFAILIESGISALITIIIYLLSKFFKELNLINSIFVYHLIYFGLLISQGLNLRELYKFKSWNYDLFIIIIAFLIWGLTYIILKGENANIKS
ncbi:hypothetical protein [Chryseobacterium sp. R2A-55]|uniref:hypothetical protein n=1 Tax=Chryseobacterium sp. R2A-55 TaxID=2744445 RepID=UPI001F224535|nr:hypothetical protein [Chryseobacterium sp. R2A-55]